MKKILVFAPHHDDEVLGFGGSIAKHVRQGSYVHVVFLKAPQTARAREQYEDAEAARKILGYQKRTDMVFRDDQLASFNGDCLRRLEQVILEYEPDILYVPHETDGHQEHHQVLNLTRVATRVWGPQLVPIILSGEILSSSGNAYQTRFNPQYYESLSSSDILTKQEALSAYQNEIRQFPHPRSSSGIKVYANKRGMESGSEYAEAFEVLRFIQL